MILQSGPRYWKLALIHTNPVRKPISAFGSSELIASGPGRCNENGCYEELDYADGPVRLISITSARLTACLPVPHACRPRQSSTRAQLMNFTYSVTTTNQPGLLEHVGYNELVRVQLGQLCNNNVMRVGFSPRFLLLHPPLSQAPMVISFVCLALQLVTLGVGIISVSATYASPYVFF